MQHKDDFDDGPGFKAAITSVFGAMKKRDRIQPRGPLWAAAIVASLILFLASVLWYSYPREMEKREMMAVPIIRADAGPYKIVPNDPGGMNIPHRDSTVFETLHAGRADQGSERRVENLLPESEEPMSREQLFAGLKTQLKVEGKEVVSAEKATAAQEPSAAPSQNQAVDITEQAELARVETAAGEEALQEKPAKQHMQPSGTTEATRTAAIAPSPQKKPESVTVRQYSRTEPASGVETFQTETAQGTHLIQFASLRSEDAARSAWDDLQKSLTFLAPLEHRIQRADLGARGVYYRLQAGPLSEGRAREICARVEAQRPGGCLVVQN